MRRSHCQQTTHQEDAAHPTRWGESKDRSVRTNQRPQKPPKKRNPNTGKSQVMEEPPAAQRPRHGLPRSRAAMAFNLWVVTHPGTPDEQGTPPAGRPKTGPSHEHKTGNETARNDTAHDKLARKPNPLSSRDTTRYATFKAKQARKRTCKGSAETGKDGKPARP